MTFLHQVPLPVNIAVLLAGLVLVVLGWRAARPVENRAGITWGRRAVMFVMIFAMGMSPATIAYQDKVQSNLAVYFVVDGTGSMAARDYNGQDMRLDGVKADLLALAGSFPGARYSVIEVTSTSTLQLPLTTDVRALFSWADVFDREYTDYSSGSDVNRPVDAVTEILEEAELSRPEDRVVLFYMGDGESTDTSSSKSDSLAEFSPWKPYIDDGAVLAYGTEDGGTMAVKPLSGEVDEEEKIIDPETDEPAISRMDEVNMRNIAEQLGLTYHHRTAPTDVTPIIDGIDSDIVEVVDRDGESVYSPIIWPFAIVLTLLIIWEVWDIIPKIKVLGALKDRPGVRK